MRPPANEAYCGADSINTITKLIYECKKYGIHLAPRAVKVDIRGEKKYQELIKETFQKPVPENSKSNYPDEDNEDHAGISTHENSVRDTRKPPEIL
jgi:hypothetical protein